MTTPDTPDDSPGGWPEDLDDAITGVYRGPLEEFVARRDALVRDLRGAGRADDAKRVKALRKPARMAWALDAAVHGDPAPVERVAAAVAALVQAQADGGDLRRATERLRTSARHLASAAGRASADAGHRVDQSTLVPAILAVIGDPDAFEDLRRGRLAEVPTSGGLDVLSLVPPRAPAVPVEGEDEAPGGGGSGGSASPELEAVDERAVADARSALDRAEAAATEAHDRADRAEQAVDDAEAALDAAEERLHQAEQDARTARADLRQAQQDARAARKQAREADSAAGKARARLRRLTGGE